ncbi:MAG: flagellar basal body rod protein FlgC [Clostridiales bacterium GWF2_38_85]|nr:MAG: flagellar basal body rod protein FlgC [Clostridiales bacterium GWF2_38_85]HBL83407.1 flagellar basal body rod protein FlgC [Clostridiales bacterium]
MAFFSSLNISGSALTAQKLRMEIVAQNIANSNTSITESGEPYRRKIVVLSEKNDSDNFRTKLYDAANRIAAYGGVEVSEIVEDDEAFLLEYDPTNPLADEEGYVKMPNINTVEEMIEMMAASRSYEANVTVFNAVKQMASKALEIGR